MFHLMAYSNAPNIIKLNRCKRMTIVIVDERFKQPDWARKFQYFSYPQDFHDKQKLNFDS